MTATHPELLTEILRRGSSLDLVRPGLLSALPDNQRGASYDAMVGGYDLLVGNSLYNRLIWGVWAEEYRQFARSALSAVPDGPILDCGCGSLCFTAPIYSTTALDRLILFDRSLGMLTAGQKRLPRGQFVQGDALSMPFVDQAFAGVFAWGFLHVMGSESGLIGELKRVTRPSGSIFLSTLVRAGRRVGDYWLRLLERQNEAIPQDEDTVVSAFCTEFALEGRTRVGNMLFLSGRAKS